MGSLTLLDLIVASMMMFVGSTVLSTVGFGIGMSTAPVLLLVLDPKMVVVMLNTVSMGLFVLIIVQDRRFLPWRQMMPVCVAGLLGAPVGVLVLSSVDPAVIRVSIAGLIILLTMTVVFDLRVPMPRSGLIGPLLGFVVGVLLISTGIGGPLIALLLLARNWVSRAVRASLSFYFLSVQLTGAIGYALAGLYSGERIRLILVVTGPVLLGFVAGSTLVRRMNERIFRHAVVAVIITTSVMVLGRELLRL